MTWLPELKIGVWNAWMLMLFVPLHPLIMLLVDKIVGSGNLFKKMGDAPADKAQRHVNTIATFLLYALFVFSIFIPLKIYSGWIVAGLIIYILGSGVFLVAILNAARTPLGQVFNQGMYRYSRHPLYLSFILILGGVSVGAASWLFLLLSAVYIILMIWQVDYEEKSCLNAFGNEYQEYMEKTPRWIGIPKLRVKQV